MLPHNQNTQIISLYEFLLKLDELIQPKQKDGNDAPFLLNLMRTLQCGAVAECLVLNDLNLHLTFFAYGIIILEGRANDLKSNLFRRHFQGGSGFSRNVEFDDVANKHGRISRLKTPRIQNYFKLMIDAWINTTTRNLEKITLNEYYEILVARLILRLGNSKPIRTLRNRLEKEIIAPLYAQLPALQQKNQQQAKEKEIETHREKIQIENNLNTVNVQENTNGEASQTDGQTSDGEFLRSEEENNDDAVLPPDDHDFSNFAETNHESTLLANDTKADSGDCGDNSADEALINLSEDDEYYAEKLGVDPFISHSLRVVAYHDDPFHFSQIPFITLPPNKAAHYSIIVSAFQFAVLDISIDGKNPLALRSLFNNIDDIQGFLLTPILFNPKLKLSDLPRGHNHIISTLSYLKTFTIKVSPESNSWEKLVFSCWMTAVLFSIADPTGSILSRMPTNFLTVYVEFFNSQKHRASVSLISLALIHANKTAYEQMQKSVVENRFVLQRKFSYPVESYTENFNPTGQFSQFFSTVIEMQRRKSENDATPLDNEYLAVMYAECDDALKLEMLGQLITDGYPIHAIHLWYAAKLGHMAIFQKLCDAATREMLLVMFDVRPNPGISEPELRPLLYQLTAEKKREYLRILISRCEKDDLKEVFQQTQKDGSTALENAAKEDSKLTPEFPQKFFTKKTLNRVKNIGAQKQEDGQIIKGYVSSEKPRRRYSFDGGLIQEMKRDGRDGKEVQWHEHKTLKK